MYIIIYSLSPEETKSTAQTLATAFYVGISGIVGSYIRRLIMIILGLNICLD
ncbi:hypothetical protein [Abyssisolibacter fermentans]|uniref:hypothetical protein n=1 Tax=Abyssisolibacter fermentans TaxID=1766203 RepID=UPI00138F4CE0|nr:hypothetical protein [Abyssisolibacter fermentans]